MTRERTNRRKNRLRSVLENRYTDLQLILEEIHNVHNISAILRTADGFGIQNINLVYSLDDKFRFNPMITQGVHKWLDIHLHNTIPEMLKKLREKNLKIYATGFSDSSVDFREVDYTVPCAIMLGNEHEGVSMYSQEHSDDVIYIPMKGFSQSFNVSVANSIILSEARRQRESAGNSGNMSPEMIEEYFKKWIEL